MKKLTTLLISTVLIISTSNATVYHVDPVGGSSNGTGETWATAVKNIEQAQVLADANPGTDDIYVKGGTLLYPGSSLVIRAANDVNVYGSFKGIDGETAATRPLIDVDGNGIIEPWEFEYPTIISSGNSNNAVVLAASIFDGFTINHTPSATVGFASSTVVGVAGATFQNNIISNSKLNVSISSTSGFGGLLIKAAGTFKNCLIEKNTVNVTVATTSDKYFTPIMDIAAGSTVTGCVVRNNKGSIDCSGSSAGPTTTVKGVIVNVYGGATGITTFVSNCIIHNNESVYLGGGGTASATLTGGSILGSSGISSNASTDYIVNCVIANNKTTNSATNFGGVNLYSTGGLVHYFENNVLWNNQLGSTIANIVCLGNPTTGQISYNMVNGAASGGLVATLKVGNSLALASANAVSSGPYFKNPTTLVGCNRVAGSADSIAIAQADWRLGSALSYLIGKGVVTSIKTDKAGKNFASTPSVGAYEFDASIAAVIPVNQNVSTLAYARDGKIISKQDGKLQIFSLTGSVIWSGNVEREQKIALSAGCYLLRLTSVKEESTQKIIL